MYQSGKARKLAEEVHICSTCAKDKDCTIKPEHFGWRYVLDYCQEYKEVNHDQQNNNY